VERRPEQMRAGVVCGSEFVGLDTVLVCSHSICSTEVMVAMADGEDFFSFHSCTGRDFCSNVRSSWPRTTDAGHESGGYGGLPFAARSWKTKDDTVK